MAVASSGGSSSDAGGGSCRGLWMQPVTTGSEEAVPGPRAAHSANLIHNKLHVIGGWNGKKGLNDLRVLDVDTMEWSVPEVSGTPPTARNNHATFVVGSRLYIHGGHDGSTWLADLHMLDTDKMVWSIPSISGVAPSARACHTCTLLGRKVYMFGGYDGTKCFNDLDVLDIDTMTWIQPHVSGVLPQARNAQTMTMVGNKLVLFGGHSGNKHLRDVHVLDADRMTWMQPEISGQIPPGLRGHTGNLIGKSVCVFGGYDGRGRSNDLYFLDTESWVWTHPRATEKTPAGRQRHTASLVGSKKLFILGGFDGFKWLNDLNCLDVGKLEESAITTAAVMSLLGNLRSLVDNPASFPDIAFIVEGTRVHAHKSILCARSGHFRAMFTSGMKESREAEVEIPDWNRPAFLAMLEFLYTGSVENLETEVAVEITGLADQMGLDGLKRLAESFLVHSLDASNVCALFSTAHRYQAHDLKRHCLRFILKPENDVSAMLETLSSEPALLMEITRESLLRRRMG